ncbi:MAG TPA: hypothetical protein V6D33_06685 [Cyanophyceae cyanobacterium]
MKLVIMVRRENGISAGTLDTSRLCDSDSLQQPWLTVSCDQLHLIAGVPQVVGHREFDISSSRDADITIPREI